MTMDRTPRLPAEVGGRRSEVRSQGSGVRRQESGIRGATGMPWMAVGSLRRPPQRLNKRLGRSSVGRLQQRTARRRFLRFEQLEYRLLLAPVNANFDSGSGALTIRDPGTNDDDNNFSLFIRAGNVVINDANNNFHNLQDWIRTDDNHSIERDVASFFNNVSVVNFVGRGGNDSLTIDYAGGDPTPGNVIFSGGDGGLDRLKITGSSASALYSPHATMPGSGTILIGGNPITFSGLEPIDYVGAPGGSFTLRPLNGNDVLSIEDSTL